MRLGHSLLLSFQRFARPADEVVESVPSSLGALAVGRRANGDLVLPIADDEAFWLGLSVARSHTRYILQIAVELAGDAVVDALSGRPFQADAAETIAVPDVPRLIGIRIRNELYRVFSRVTADPRWVACKALRVCVVEDQSDESRGSDNGKNLRAELADYEEYECLTGLQRPEPLNSDYAYKGWLLP